MDPLHDIKVEMLRHFYNKPYVEENIIQFFNAQNYTVISFEFVALPKELVGSDVIKLRRFHMKNNISGNHITLFIGIDSEGKATRTNVLNFPTTKYSGKKVAETIGCLLPIIIVAGLLIWFVVVIIGDILEDSNERDVDTYEYNPDDKDSDGDVDYDDVEKYLDDSLEEDKNDGDDW